MTAFIMAADAQYAQKSVPAGFETKFALGIVGVMLLCALGAIIYGWIRYR